MQTDNSNIHITFQGGSPSNKNEKENENEYSTEKEEEEDPIKPEYITIHTPPNKASRQPTEEEQRKTKFFIESLDESQKRIFHIMVLRQNILNTRIGTQSWKKYISAAFWNYISTPINFSITLLTAVSTGQAASTTILTQQQTLIILFVTFVLTTVNSFFKLNTKMNLNFEAARKYYSFGYELENIYYSPLNSMDDVKTKIEKYSVLNRNICNYVLSETIDSQNYLTDFIYYLLTKTEILRYCICGSINFTKWINEMERDDTLDGYDVLYEKTTSQNPKSLSVFSFFTPTKVT